MRPILLILMITFLSSGVAFGGDYNLVDEFRVPPAEGAIAADPIVGANGALAGFVYILPDEQTLLIGELGKSAYLSSALVGHVMKTVNCYVADTLFVYALLATTTAAGSSTNHPAVQLIKIHGGSVSTIEVTPTYNRPSDQLMSLLEVTHVDLRFCETATDDYSPLILSCREMYYDWIITQGPIYEAASTTIVFSPNLDSVLHRDGTTSLVRGRFTGSKAPGTCGYTFNHRSWDFTDYWGDPNSYSYSSATVSAIDDAGNVLAVQSTQDTYTLETFSGDFVDDAGGCDELICSGYAKDLLGLHGTTPRGHVACYSFHDGIPKEEWYRQLTPDLDFYFAWGGVITEIRNSAQIAHLDVSNGQFTEVHSVPLSGYTRFFTTGLQNSELTLLTLQNDTLRHYRYDIATPVEEPGVGPNLPRSFFLEQNYPNPFNGETVIGFQLTRPENIRISVYNVRGQQVAQIANGPFVSGSHQVTWKPADDIASGVYFVSLSGNSGSQSVRMQYVK